MVNFVNVYEDKDLYKLLTSLLLWIPENVYGEFLIIIFDW